MNDESFQKLRDGALKLLSIRPRSTAEIKNKLTYFAKKRKLSSDHITNVISYLTEQNLLSDRDFALWWITQRATFRPKGWRLVEQELRAKGIDRSIIKDLRPDKSNEYESAQKVATKKMRLFTNLPSQKAKQRIQEALSRRGFSWDTISRVIDEME